MNWFSWTTDGSADRTQTILKDICAIDPRVTGVRLRRNFGQTAALAAGFDHAAGEIVIAMDGDLQHRPEDIPRFLAKLDEGYDVVSGWRQDRQDGFRRTFPSKIANKLMARASGVPSTISARRSKPTGATCCGAFRSTARCTASCPRWPTSKAR